MKKKFKEEMSIVDLKKETLHSGDLVSWEIETNNLGDLVAESTDPFLTFTISAPDPGPPLSHKKTPDTILTYTKPFTPGVYTYDVPYTVSLKNGTSTTVATGYLVIDTIGDGGVPGPDGGDVRVDRERRHQS